VEENGVGCVEANRRHMESIQEGFIVVISMIKVTPRNWMMMLLI